MLDLFSAAPATAALQQALLRVPWLALVGSVAMTAVTIATMFVATTSRRTESTRDQRDRSM
jgi:hypothetical protein